MLNKYPFKKMNKPKTIIRIKTILEPEDIELIEKLLSDKAQKKIEFKIPQKGEKLRFVEMAENNSRVTLENKEKDKTEILLELKEVLGLEKIPRKIETYDISNISGTDIVASMVVFEDGKPKKKDYKRLLDLVKIGLDSLE